MIKFSNLKGIPSLRYCLLSLSTGSYGKILTLAGPDPRPNSETKATDQQSMTPKTLGQMKDNLIEEQSSEDSESFSLYPESPDLDIASEHVDNGRSHLSNYSTLPTTIGNRNPLISLREKKIQPESTTVGPKTTVSTTTVPDEISNLIQEYFADAGESFREGTTSKTEETEKVIENIYKAIEFLRKTDSKSEGSGSGAAGPAVYYEEFIDSDSLLDYIEGMNKIEKKDYIDLIIRKRDYSVVTSLTNSNTRMDEGATDLKYGYRVRFCLKKYHECVDKITKKKSLLEHDPDAVTNQEIKRNTKVLTDILSFNVIDIEKLHHPMKIQEQSLLIKKLQEIEDQQYQRPSHDLSRTNSMRVQAKHDLESTKSEISNDKSSTKSDSESFRAAAKELNDYVSSASKQTFITFPDAIDQNDSNTQSNTGSVLNPAIITIHSSALFEQLSTSRSEDSKPRPILQSFAQSFAVSPFYIGVNKSEELTFFKSLAKLIDGEIENCPVCLKDFNSTNFDSSEISEKCNVFPHCCATVVCKGCFNTHCGTIHTEDYTGRCWFKSNCIGCNGQLCSHRDSETVPNPNSLVLPEPHIVNIGPFGVNRDTARAAVDRCLCHTITTASITASTVAVIYFIIIPDLPLKAFLGLTAGTCGGINLGLFGVNECRRSNCISGNRGNS